MVDILLHLINFSTSINTFAKLPITQQFNRSYHSLQKDINLFTTFHEFDFLVYVWLLYQETVNR